MSQTQRSNGHPLARIETGSIDLDAILGGGFPANAIHIIMGEPGTGKTILAEHLMFANAREDERPILYLSTISEPLGKVVKFLQQFDFYDESRLGGPIQYDSIGEQLIQYGPAMLVPKLTEVIKEIGPKIIVIDSFKAINDLTSSLPEARQMLYQMAGLLTAYETTAFLIGEYSEEDAASRPEFAVADGIISLARNKVGSRDERFLRVLKLRGSGYLEGLHGFHISSAGLEVYPRLVSPIDPPQYQMLEERVSTGIERLSSMLGGGPFRGTTTLLIGPTGSGKTTLGLQFAMAGAEHGENAIYLHLEENPTQLSQQIRSLGHDPAVTRERGLVLLYKSAVELQIDSIVADLFRSVRKHNARRLVVDGVGDLLLAASDPQRVYAYLYAMSQHLAVEGVATVYTYEGSDRGGVDRMSALADNIIVLGIEWDAPARRTLRIAKARGISHDLGVHELKISSNGIQVE